MKKTRDYSESLKEAALVGRKILDNSTGLSEYLTYI